MHEKILEEMIGKSCWHVGAGGCTGSMFILHMGAKVQRKKPLPRPDHPLTHFHGEARVFVQDGQWTLYHHTKRVAWDESDSRVDGELAQGLRKLLNLKLVEASAADGLLTLSFEDQLILKIGPRKSNDTNSPTPIWSLSLQGERVTLR
jgi:hypothetical protein